MASKKASPMERDQKKALEQNHSPRVQEATG